MVPDDTPDMSDLVVIPSITPHDALSPPDPTVISGTILLSKTAITSRYTNCYKMAKKLRTKTALNKLSISSLHAKCRNRRQITCITVCLYINNSSKSR